MQLRKPNKIGWAKELLGMPREFHAEVEVISRDDARAEEKGHLQELRRHVFEAGIDTKAALRNL